MKNKIYRTVSVEDRLPKHGGHFLTDIGIVRFMINDKEWVYDNYITCNPNWWLEEIELPTENKVHESIPHYRYDAELDHAFQDGYYIGANFILNHIKGG